MKKWLCTFLFILVAATAAVAYPTEGPVGNQSGYEYSRLAVDDKGTVTFVLHNNTTDDVLFHGRILFLDDPSNTTVADTNAFSLKLAAEQDVRVTTQLRNGTPKDANNAPRLAWGEVLIQVRENPVY